MIRQDRVRIMTDMAIYEKREGKQDEKIDAYYKSDYMSSEFLKSFLSATFSFMIVAAVYCVYHFEELMLTIYGMDIREMVIGVIRYYLIFVAVFLVITYLVYNKRYERTRTNLRKYYRELKELSADYERDEEQ